MRTTRSIRWGLAASLVFVLAAEGAARAPAAAPAGLRTPGGRSVGPAGREVPLSAPRLGPAAGWQSEVAVASNGSDYLAVWSDARDESTNADLYGTRISGDGRILDPTGILIARAPEEQGQAAVAWDGHHYVVVWADRRSGRSATYAARVTDQGRVLDRNGFPLAPGGEAQSAPAVAASDGRSLVVWDEIVGPERTDIFGIRVDADGRILDEEKVRLSSLEGLELSPSVARATDRYLVAFTHEGVDGGRDIRAVRVSASGDLLDTVPIAVSTSPLGEESASVASAGGDFLVVWSRHRDESDFTSDLDAARVSPGGGVTPIGSLVEGPGDDVGAGTSWNGSHYLLTWVELDSDPENLRVLGARVTPEGQRVDETPTVYLEGASVALGTSSAAAGDEWLVGSQTDGEARLARVDASNAVADGSPFVASIAASRQRHVDVASGTGLHLAVWEEWNGSDRDVLATRLGEEGRILDPEPIPVSTVPGDQEQPQVAWDGRRFLVVWQDGRGTGATHVFATTVGPGGRVGRTRRLSPAGGSHGAPALDWDGRSYLVVWERVTRRGRNVLGRRLAPSGAPRDEVPIVVSAARGDQEAPDVAFNGRDFYVVWHDGRGEDVEIFGARVTPGGRVLDEGGIRLTRAPRPQIFPAVDCRRGTCLAVWSDLRRPPRPCENPHACDFVLFFAVFGTRIGRDGLAMDPRGLRIAGARQADLRYPVVRATGSGFLAAWEAVQAGWAEAALVAVRYDIRGALIDPAGGVAWKGALAAKPSSHELSPSLGAGAAGAVLVYDRFVTRSGLRSRRAFARLLDVATSGPDAEHGGSGR